MLTSSSKTDITLTDQQRAVVDHDDGPALVFAVAGAGKTTAMVHRIERLVREQRLAPEQILATSFGRANVRDLRRALRPWRYCGRVDVRTLHSLGRDVIARARRAGYLPHLKLDRDDEVDISLEQQLLSRTLSEAYRLDAPYKRELDTLDRQDFLSYVGYCKGNLLYADLERVDLAQAARKLAEQAPSPPGPLAWYLDLYELLERVRGRLGWITFDDMLLTGWELLVTYPDVLQEVSSAYRSILVDEFQDINLAQSEILHLLAQPHGNYMAIGDDDQTIYEWRGANPQFILDFARRYHAHTYLISDNFRCPAAPLVLANHVIAHNRRREPKRLSLTRGFGGNTLVHLDQDVETMSRHIVDRIQRLHQEGLALNEMAVLVRLNAQTPAIEQHLITREIPYRVSKPFYERREIETLIQYGRVAWVDHELRAGRQPLASEGARAAFVESWRNVCNRPKRYISHEVREQMQRRVVMSSQPVSRVVQDTAMATPHEWLADSLLMLAEDIAWLANNLDQPADEILRQLEARLGYKHFLKGSSGFPQTGEGRAAGVDAFIAYAAGRGSFFDFLQHVRQLARRRVGQEQPRQDEAVTLTTIHQAKGLEWPVVFVAQCNQNIIPFHAERASDIEEERRLFYVALTRTRRHLDLHAVKNEPLSQFLKEAGWNSVLPAVRRLESLLARDPQSWQAAEALQLARAVTTFHLERYLQRWWSASDDRKTAVTVAMQRFFAAVQHSDLLQPLALTAEQAHFWTQLVPQPDTAGATTFPGLDKLTPRAKRP